MPKQYLGRLCANIYWDVRDCEMCSGSGGELDAQINVASEQARRVFERNVA